MHWKLLAGCACSAALLLGACSGGTPTAPTPTTPTEPTDPTTPEEPTTQYDRAKKQNDDARMAVTAAVAQAGRATTAQEISDAIAEIERVRGLITSAIAAARMAAEQEYPDTVEGNTLLGRAVTLRDDLLRDEEGLNTQLSRAESPLFWSTGTLVRYRLLEGTAREPAYGMLRGDIVRIDRTTDTSDTDDTQKANPAAIPSDGFDDVMYENANDGVFLVSDDEFRVDGYVSPLFSANDGDDSIKTGLKITSEGPEIRTGGAVITANDDSVRGPGSGIVVNLHGNYLDLRKKVTTGIGAGALNTAGWDITIKFGTPDPLPVDDDITSRQTGNGEFHWRAIAKPYADQLDPTKGDYYAADIFTRLSTEGYERLGTYDLWLSNHADLDLRNEPTDTTLPPHTSDDVNHYLKYAAYGMFLFKANPTLGGFSAATTELTRWSRGQAMHFGYEAFDDETGKKTTDIGEAITGGTFRGLTRAYAYRGALFPGATTTGATTNYESKQLRGRVQLTVTIPDTTGTAATISGRMSDFEEWINGAYWFKYSDGFRIDFDSDLSDAALDPIAIGDDGTFRGRVRLTAGSTDPLTTTNVNEDGRGEVTGNFYGPKDDPDNLEIAGSWVLGHYSGTAGREISEWNVLGSFGAKQRPN